MAAERNAALLANFRTRNLGNHALTRVMQSLVSRAYGDDRTLRLHRMPHPITDVVTTAPPEQWGARTQRLVRVDPASADPGRLARPRTIELPAAGAESNEPGLVRRVATSFAHTTPGLWARALGTREAGREHLTGLLAADDVIWVPGGEITSTGVPMGRLLDVTIAQEAGKRVVIADLSFEPAPAARPVFERLAPGITLAIPRDERSAERFVDIGIPAERVRVIPDAVFLLGSEVLPSVEIPRATSARPRLAVVIHGLIALDVDAWRAAIRAALARGYDVEIVSSHLEHDTVEIRRILRDDLAGDVSVAPEFTDLQAYLDHLSGFTALLAARFHSAVMGVLVGLTVSAVDTYGTKVGTGLLAAGIDEAVLAPEGVGSSSWVERFEARLDDGRPVDADRIAALQRRIIADYDEVLDSDLG